MSTVNRNILVINAQILLKQPLSSRKGYNYENVLMWTNNTYEETTEIAYLTEKKQQKKIKIKSLRGH